MSEPAKRGRPRKARDETHPLVTQILDAALNLFSTLGYEATTLRAIAAATGIEPGHFSYYYRSKEDLWDDVLQTFTTGLNTVIAQANAVNLTNPDTNELGNFLDSFIDFAATTPAFSRLLLQEFTTHSKRRNRILETISRPAGVAMVPIFAAIASRLPTGTPPELLYYTMVSSCAFVIGCQPEIAEVSNFQTCTPDSLAHFKRMIRQQYLPE